MPNTKTAHRPWSTPKSIRPAFLYELPVLAHPSGAKETQNPYRGQGEMEARNYFRLGYEARWAGRPRQFKSDHYNSIIRLHDRERTYLLGWDAAERDINLRGLDYGKAIEADLESAEDLYAWMLVYREDALLTDSQRQGIHVRVMEALLPLIHEGHWTPPAEELEREIRSRIQKIDWTIGRLQDQGATDEVLRDFVGDEFKRMSSYSATLTPFAEVGFEGGKSPQVWGSSVRGHGREKSKVATLGGKALLRTVRSILGIPTPEEAQDRKSADVVLRIEIRNAAPDAYNEMAKEKKTAASDFSNPWQLGRRVFLDAVEYRLRGLPCPVQKHKEDEVAKAGWKWADGALKSRTSLEKENLQEQFALAI